MSADNWDYCPFCQRNRAAAIAAEKAEVDASYGNVSVTEFDAMRARLAEREAENVERTWREDYEVGLVADEFYVSYGGSCSVCGHKHSFKHSENLTPPNAQEGT